MYEAFRSPLKRIDETALLLDVRGLLCPMPVIKLQDCVYHLKPGDRVEMIATDPGVKADIPMWCEINAHHILASQDAEESYSFVIEVGEGKS